MRVLLLLALLALPTSAVAMGTRSLDIAPGQFHRAIAVASEHWPQSRCRGRERIVAAPLADKDTPSQPNVLGYAPVDRCTIALDVERIDRSEYSLMWTCTLLAHEFGHLARARHSRDPDDVMYPNIRSASDRCFDAFINVPEEVGTTRIREGRDLVSTGSFASSIREPSGLATIVCSFVLAVVLHLVPLALGAPRASSRAR